MPRKDDKMNRQIMVRLTDELLAAIDEWRRKELDLPTRSEALRRLAIAALKAEGEQKTEKPKGRKPS
jgi:metal-responsive CopG/Arc/MetJ family transcriptional regulator